ncbi:MAG: Omp28-related outer membrane protein [Winogradskyella sp.]|nr:Omp28-related outer membrane protein [Winogradskyella sp.]
MKIRFSTKILFFLFALIILGCSSSSDDENPGGNTNTITSITLARVGTGTLFPGDTVAFEVKGNTNAVVTSSSSITVNGTPINGSSYQTNSAGQLSVSATYENLTSNTIQITVDPEPVITSISLFRVGNAPIYPGDTVTFQVVGDTSEDVTNQSTISVNGTPLTNNTYQTTTVGNLDVTATYDGLNSNTLQVTVAPPPTKFTKNALIEDYTGTWCQFCPRVSHAIDLVNGQTDDAIVVAIHRGNTNPASGSYDPYNFNAGALEDMINLTGYPTAMLDRTTDWTFPEPNNVAQVTNLTGDNADLGLAMSPTLNGNNVSVEVKVKFGGEISNPILKIVLYLLEDGLEFNQTNGTSYYGGVNPLVNFEHNHVLRAAFTDLLGVLIPSAEIVGEEEYTTTITGMLPASIENNSNLSLVAIVVDAITNDAINSRSANFGDSQTFQEE